MQSLLVRGSPCHAKDARERQWLVGGKFNEICKGLMLRSGLRDRGLDLQSQQVPYSVEPWD